MIAIGITGGIGSGKTEVCNVWKKLGAYIVNADDLAKELMVKDEAIRTRIKETFGPESYNSDGSLNRTFLAKQAFRKGRVEELNAIVHPKIPEESRKIKEEAMEQGYEVFVYEAALLFQNLRPNFLDYIVLVLADRKRRVERVQKRDGVESEEVLSRIKNQQDFGKLGHLADFIIQNNGTLEELREKSEQLYTELLTLNKKN